MATDSLFYCWEYGIIHSTNSPSTLLKLARLFDDIYIKQIIVWLYRCWSAVCFVTVIIDALSMIDSCTNIPRHQSRWIAHHHWVHWRSVPRPQADAALAVAAGPGTQSDGQLLVALHPAVLPHAGPPRPLWRHLRHDAWTAAPSGCPAARSIGVRAVLVWRAVHAGRHCLLSLHRQVRLIVVSCDDKITNCCFICQIEDIEGVLWVWGLAGRPPAGPLQCLAWSLVRTTIRQADCTVREAQGPIPPSMSVIKL